MSSLSAQVPLDLDLNRRAVADSTLPWGWNFFPHLQSGYAVSLVEGAAAASPGPTLEIRAPESAVPALAVYRIPTPIGVGQELAFSARVDGVDAVSLGVVARQIINDQFMIVAADTGVVPRDGSATARIGVPDGVDMVDLWIHSSGTGVARIFDLALTVDGVPASAADSAEPAPSTREVAWVQEHALDWGSTESLNGDRAFPGLREMVGDARVVMIGESTHGTSEFFKLKHRMTQALSRDLGFTIVALEDHMAGVGALDRRLREPISGDGPANPDPLTGMFGMFNRTEFHDFLESVRATGEPELWGVDMQDPLPAMDRVIGFLATAHPEMVPEASGRFESLRQAWADGGVHAADSVAFEQWKADSRGVQGMLTGLSSQGPADPEDLQVALRMARIVEQAIHLAETRDPDVRDRYMAENLLWLLELRPDAKVVFWGHNGHVRLSAGGMGAHLRAALGSGVLSLGLLTHQGSYTALWPRDGVWRPGTFRLFDAPSRSVEHLLHAAGIEMGALDLRSVPHEGPGSWLNQDLQIRSIGGTPTDYGFQSSNPVRTFDGLVFVNQTSAAALPPA